MKCTNCNLNWGDVFIRRKGEFKGKAVCDTCNSKEVRQ